MAPQPAALVRGSDARFQQAPSLPPGRRHPVAGKEPGRSELSDRTSVGLQPLMESVSVTAGSSLALEESRAEDLESGKRGLYLLSTQLATFHSIPSQPARVTITSFDSVPTAFSHCLAETVYFFVPVWSPQGSHVTQ